MKTNLILLLPILMVTGACNSPRRFNEYKASNGKAGIPVVTGLAERNLLRAMELADSAVTHYLQGEDQAMARFFNPFTHIRSEEKGSVWMYTAAIESVNAILHALNTNRTRGHTTHHDTHFVRYRTLLDKLYKNLAYYQGTFELTSFTQTREWTIYGVHRAKEKGRANVAGIENVYDDQQWLVRELLQSYKLTGEARYLHKAEYLTAYILDGWDCTLDQAGNEHGGIPWGPGYVTKHACSNGPFVSPLVWLHEHYLLNDDAEIVHRYIAPDGKRKTETLKKRDYYRQFAIKVYEWQKNNLLNTDGIYNDFMGGCGKCKVNYETVDGIRYRANTLLLDPVGPAYSYNTGAPLSGAVDLYRITHDSVYLNDIKQLSTASFRYFAKPNEQLLGYHTYAVNGFNNWFNGILMRAYIEASAVYGDVSSYILTFQQNLDYGYENFLHQGILPSDLLKGWNNSDHNVEGMFAFTFATEYALLSEYE